MNLKRARYIIAIHEAGGFTAAAKKLFVSQPSLSQTVRLVEQEMGIAIFEHGSTPPKLTYAGEKYLQTARAMIAQEENLNTILEGIRHEERGLLRIGVSLQRGMQLLPMVLPEFTRLYPDVQLSLAERGSGYLEQMVDDGKIDIALATTEPANRNLEYLLVESESYGLLTGRESPLLAIHQPGDWIDLREAASETFMSLKEGHNSRGIQDRVFARCGISPKILAETDSLEAAIRITVACSCCMLCPHVFVRSNPAAAGSGVYFQLKNIVEGRHFYICYRRDKYLPSYIRTFIKLVQDVTRKSSSNTIQGAAGA